MKTKTRGNFKLPVIVTILALFTPFQAMMVNAASDKDEYKKIVAEIMQ